MKKIKLIIILISFYSTALSQNSEIPITNEIPKRGIYRSFEEFKFNVPITTDSFYVESKVRSQKNWEGTMSYTPRYTRNNKKVKKIWGFSDSKNVYAFHQWEFFKVKLDTPNIGFYAYQQIDNSGAAAAGLIGGAIGGGVYAAVAIDIAKKKRIYYELNPLNGELNAEITISDSLNNEVQFTKLIVYRRNKNEMNAPLAVSINDSIYFQLTPTSVEEFEIPISREPVKICYGNNTNQCIDLISISSENKYFEGSISSKKNEIKLEQVKIEVGEFYAKQVKFFQEKRENQDNK